MLFAQVVARWDRAGGRKKGAEMKEGRTLEVALVKEWNGYKAEPGDCL